MPFMTAGPVDENSDDEPVDVNGSIAMLGDAGFALIDDVARIWSVFDTEYVPDYGLMQVSDRGVLFDVDGSGMREIFLPWSQVRMVQSKSWRGLREQAAG